MAMPLRPFHLAAISLVLLALLPTTTAAESTTSTSLSPRASSALPVGSPGDAPSSATRRRHTSPVARRPEDHEDASAPSPQAAPPTTRLDLPAHAAARARVTRYRATLADLHYVCRAPRCFADPVHRLLSALNGPHVRVGSGGDDDDVLYGFGVARTIEGTRPILPSSAWRAYVYSGGDVCHVELNYMKYDEFYDAACPAWTCQAYFILSPKEALASALRAIATPCGGGDGETSSAAASAPTPHNAVALLPVVAAAAAAFLPPPLATAVVLSSLAPLALATTDLPDDEYTKLNHAACAVYAYDNATGAADRERPVPGLCAVCLRPLCIDLEERHGDPLRVYCAVRSLEGPASPSIFFPWRNTWRAHLPVAHPGAAAASGDRICYVELAHMDYREGYCVRCTDDGGHAHVSCTEFPDEAAAAAVWEHRSLTYRETVTPSGKCERYKYCATGQQFWASDRLFVGRQA